MCSTRSRSWPSQGWETAGPVLRPSWRGLWTTCRDLQWASYSLKCGPPQSGLSGSPPHSLMGSYLVSSYVIMFLNLVSVDTQLFSSVSLAAEGSQSLDSRPNGKSTRTQPTRHLRNAVVRCKRVYIYYTQNEKNTTKLFFCTANRQSWHKI